MTSPSKQMAICSLHGDRGAFTDRKQATYQNTRGEQLGRFVTVREKWLDHLDLAWGLAAKLRATAYLNWRGSQPASELVPTVGNSSIVAALQAAAAWLAELRGCID